MHTCAQTYMEPRTHICTLTAKSWRRDGVMGTRREGREGPRVCMHVAHSNSNAHMHENTRTVRSTVGAASRSRAPEEPADHGTAAATRG
jgi:hypothetical protein